MNRMRKLGCLAGLWLYSCPLAGQGLRIGASAYLSEPYTIYKKSQLHSGIIKDVFDQLGAELSLSIHYVDLPRKRVEPGLMSGEIHIAPIAHPQWLSKEYSGDWSEPLFTLRELLVTRKDSKLQYHGPKDLKGLRIGTILGYSYPVVDPYFQSGEIQRSDVQRADQNVDMLLTQRIDGYIVHDLIYHYFRKIDARGAELRAVELGSTERDISWAVSKKSPVPLARLKDFIRKLKKSGRLEQIMKRYQLAGDVEVIPPAAP